MKYKNTSGFRQTVIIEGKKQVIFADDVFEQEKELINPAFEKVSDDTEVTFKARSIRKTSGDTHTEAISLLENKLNEVQKGTENLPEAVSKISELQKSVETSKTKHADEFAALRDEFEKFKTLVHRRLEILKNAVKTIEYEVGQLYGEEAEEPKGFQPPTE
jgi:hypothetical protein